MASKIIPQNANVFHRIKEEIDTRDIIDRYLPDRDFAERGGRLVGLCPLHDEKTASFTVFLDSGYAKCFGCGWGGDIVSLVAALLKLKPIEAARHIARDFGLPITGKLSPAARRQAEEAQKQREKVRQIEAAFKQRLSEAHEVLSLLVRTTERSLQQGLAAYEELSGLVDRLPLWEQILIDLESKDISTRIEGLKAVKQWVI